MKKDKELEEKIEDFFEKYDHLLFLPDFDSFSFSEDEIISLFKVLFEKEREYDFTHPLYYKIEDQFCGNWNVEEKGDPKFNNVERIIFKIGDSLADAYVNCITIFATKEGNFGINYSKASASSSEDDFYATVIFPKAKANVALKEKN